MNKSACVRRKDVLTRQLGSAGSEKHNKEDSLEVQELIARQGGEQICMKIEVCCLKEQLKNCLGPDHGRSSSSET